MDVPNLRVCDSCRHCKLYKWVGREYTNDEYRRVYKCVKYFIDEPNLVCDTYEYDYDNDEYYELAIENYGK